MTTTNTGARNNVNSAASYRPSTASDLYSEYDRLRASSPVVHSDDFEGFWSVLTFADASKASRDWKNFASGRPFVEYPSPNRPIPIATNPPEHTFYRTFLNKYFRPDRVARLSPDIDHIVAEQLTPLIEAGEGDIYRSVARTVPPQVLSVLLGLSDEGWVELAATLDRADALRHEISAFGALQATLWDDAVNTLIADRTEHPRDPEQDVMSGILELRPDGEPISPEQVLSFGTQISPRAQIPRARRWDHWRTTWPRTPTTRPACGPSRICYPLPSRKCCASGRRCIRPFVEPPPMSRLPAPQSRQTSSSRSTSPQPTATRNDSPIRTGSGSIATATST